MKLVALAVALFVLPLFAHADFESAMRFRNAVEWTKTDAAKTQATTTLKLRTTRGFDQGGSQFCWVFSSMNMLETDFLQRHPDAKPEQVEVSRWYFKEITPESDDTRGTAVDALYHYSPRIGLLAYPDYKEGQIFTQTVFMNETMTPAQLRDYMLGGEKFWSYGFSETQQGWAQHPDPDALDGTLAYYVHPSKKAEIFSKAFNMGRAVTISVAGHAIAVYGADFDANGDAVKYYIKDSYPGYFYEASAERMYRDVWEITAPAELQ